MTYNTAPTIDIMKVSGHKTEREFLKYINVTKEETARTLSNHPYFNDSRMNITLHQIFDIRQNFRVIY